MAEDYQQEEEPLRAPPGYGCPRCACINTRRTHRRGWEHLLRAIGVRAFRCEECGYRFYSKNRI